MDSINTKNDRKKEKTQSCHPEAGFFPLWRWPEGKQPLLRFDKLIFTTYDGNNCFILLRATLGKAA
jgi:hypothetical protein